VWSETPDAGVDWQATSRFYNSYPWAKPARRDENVRGGSVPEGDTPSCREQEPANRLLWVSRRTGRCRAPSWAARRSV